ncbi:hypothetical protein BT96DRAFT_371525 [Gymnopus androsaceus JB14]|uniref:Nucleoporin NSP1 n=1 Tax=Gymnopus androsaceus JB14 TaxID=1447944 RepID=A0A6A4II75_9AGAR|nr:hypothetical protein BT96DRAFT_371525 [Gymnopus androsaceus JB14]
MSLFGSNTGSSGQAAGTTGGSIFGGGNAGTGGSTGTPSIFGTPASGSSIFGNNPTPNAPASGTSIFGGSGTATPTAPSGGLFGGSSTNNAAAAAPSTSSTNSLFGGGSFQLPKPTDQANKDAPKPATSSFFSNPTQSTNTLGNGLFGKPAENTAGTSTTTPGTGLLGGGLLGGGMFGKPAAPSTTQTSAATTSASPFTLGGSSNSSAPATSTGGGLFGPAKPAENNDKAPTAPALATGGLFSAQKPEEKKDAAAPGLSGGVGLSKPGDKPGLLGTSALGTSALGSSTAPPVAVPPPSLLRGKTIEEIVNKWSSELETHVKEFNKFAAEVSVWDRALIDNSNNLAALYSHVLAAEREQAEVDQSLDHIEQQQKDLAATLDAYEKVTDEIFGGQGGSLRALDTGPADTERDKNYMLATDLHTHLDDLSGSLTQMIDAVNGLSIPAGNDKSQEDPMGQISQILSSHLDSLQWIDGAVREIEGKVTDVERRVSESGHASSLSGNPSKSRGFR